MRQIRRENFFFHLFFKVLCSCTLSAFFIFFKRSLVLVLSAPGEDEKEYENRKQEKDHTSFILQRIQKICMDKP